MVWCWWLVGKFVAGLVLVLVDAFNDERWTGNAGVSPAVW